MNERIKTNYGRDTSLIYYDVTNYYFETDEQNDFLHKGISKEHRPNPIIQMGLFMDNRGIPITYELFPGNRSEEHTSELQSRFDLVCRLLLEKKKRRHRTLPIRMTL